ncbi:MAG: polyamine aminopropyltransferase [Caldibacillus debilis]|jgi:spermidine synthase|uniref:Polyamine aminopropyltransferase n=1 Tax=Caldibacillus debilis TaxID=301148 RepID=A0A150M6G4_9BACI|nr:polyamine aminopropyltransferase [Caldibacillus debilis]KYD19951.1 Spermidine synthase [Caldibacillus debilis]MBY6271021.1 polyamine aminopropyltransferase [Bacillaceae bacterium]OUM89576.1 MAG: spermidine synthase [Caldibacillus debilis]REJ16755.1 MAG: polyamine aminopropyltransferase [Caldibacillus debilis]
MTKYPEWIEEKDGSLWLTEYERENLKISYRLKEIIFSESSPFQHVMIVDTFDFGRALVLDGIVQTTALDGHIYNEMITHVPLCLHPNPKKVLIIGGGDCGAAREAAKYPHIERIDMVEIDELVVKACKAHLPEISGNLSDPRVHFIFDDGLRFVKDRRNEYDVVIVDSSDPIGPAEHLFERGFYEDLHRVLKDDGIMVCQSQSPVFHQNVLRNTASILKELFAFSKTYIATVPTYPGGLWSFTAGSKTYPLDRFPDRITPVETKYFNEEILKSCFSLPTFMKNFLPNG